jgi:PadR family transcriptional regulator, regulatory protein PadR
MSPPLKRQFFLGFIRIHILYHASREPVCGVELIQELARHGYKLSPGTLYPILHSLYASGYLHCAIQITGGRQRKAYRLTQRGTAALKQARRLIDELVREVMEDQS